MNLIVLLLPRARIVLATILALTWLSSAPSWPADLLGPHGVEWPARCIFCHDRYDRDPLRILTPPHPERGSWYGRQAELCLMCHRWGGLAGASPMLRLAIDVGAHGFTPGVVWTPDSWVGEEQRHRESYSRTKLPYTSGQLLECSSCHNVHNVTSRPFNHRPDIEALCRDCHKGRENPGRVGRGNFTMPGPGYSTHPTGVTVTDLPGNGPTAFGKIDPRLTVTVQERWVLGGHLTNPTSADASVTPFSCQTCHAIHGSTERPGKHSPGLLAIFEPSNPSAICLGCHRIVGGHPTAGVPGTLLTPSSFVSAQGRPPAWGSEQHLDGGATPFDPAVGEAPACTSCHDVHGGLPGTSLLFGPNTVGGGGGNWCFNCHPARALLPAGHEPLGGEEENAISACEQCHRAGGKAFPLRWNAHEGNGFVELPKDEFK